MCLHTIRWGFHDMSVSHICKIIGLFVKYVKLRVGHAPVKPGTFSRHRLQRKLVSVPWFRSGSLTRDGMENVPGIRGACATRKCTYLAHSVNSLHIRPVTRKMFPFDDVIMACRWCITKRSLCFKSITTDNFTRADYAARKWNYTLTSDAILRQRSGSTLDQAMTCCLMAGN